MADFLSNLLDRTFRPAAVLQRRRPSLFEPMVQPAPDTLESPPIEPVEVDAPSTVGRERAAAQADHAQPSAVGSRRRRAAPTATVAGETQDIASEAPEHSESDRAGRRAFRLARNEDTPPFHAGREESRPAGTSIATRASPQTISRTEVTRVVERIIEHVPSAAPILASPLSHGDPQRARPAPLVEAPSVLVGWQRERSPAEPDTVKPIAGLRSDTPSTLIAAPRPSHTVPRAADAPPQAPPAPTIQVTIGRVEIRATQQAPAPRDARPATPRLSLEEYLRSRSGGAR